MLPGVREVVRITQPYKLASRAFRPEGTVVELPRGVRIGGTEVVVAAGPCSVESAEQIDVIAERVAKAGRADSCAAALSSRAARRTVFRAWAKKACVMMREAADKNGLLVVSEVMDASQIQLMLPYVDILQVGARNMQNYFLLRALGAVAKPVLLKRGMSATIEELLLSAEYIMAGGNHNVILCERGIRTFETAHAQHAGHRRDSRHQEAVASADSGRSVAWHRTPRQGSSDGSRGGGRGRRRPAPRSSQRSRARAFRRRAVALTSTNSKS